MAPDASTEPQDVAGDAAGPWLEAAVVEAIHDGVLLTGVDGRVVRANRAFRELTGFAAEELVGRGPPYPFWPQAQAGQAQRRWQSMLDLDGGELDVTLRRFDGRLVDTVASAAPVADRGGTVVGYVATFKDLSSAQFAARVERALRRVAGAGPTTGARFARVCAEVSELLDMPMVTIARADRPDWLTRVAAVGVGERLPTRAALSDPTSTAARVVKTGRLARIDDLARIEGPLARAMMATGVRYAVSAPIRVGGVTWGALTVLSERPGALRADEERLLERFTAVLSSSIADAQSRERLEEQAVILGSLQDALVVLDASGTVTRVNAALCRLTGFAEQELVGSRAPYPFAGGAPGEDEVAPSGAPVQRALRRKDGRLVAVMASVGLLHDADGRPAGRAAVFTDISETVWRARVEAALQRVAASVAAEASSAAVAELVVKEVAALLDVATAALARFDAPDVVALTTAGLPGDAARSAWLTGPGSPAAAVARTGGAVRVDDYAAVDGPAAQAAAAAGVHGAVAVPVRVAGAPWGALAVLADRPDEVPAGTEALLDRFAEHVAAAVVNAENRRSLQEQAVILASLQEGLLVVDAGGRVTRVNDALCEMTGFDHADLDGAVPPYPFSGPDGGELAETAGVVARTLRSRGGGLVHVAASVTALHGLEGELAGRAGVFRDVSETVFQARLERALREVAAAGAAGDRSSGELFDLVAHHIAGLLGTAAAAVVRFDGERGTIVGSEASVPLPEYVPLDEPSATTMVRTTGRPERVDDYAAVEGAFARRMVEELEWRSTVAVPVRVHGRLWGCFTTLHARAGGLPPATEQLLERFAALVSVALANADTLARLQEQATTDGLTGLLNHRAFHDRLRAEHLGAARHGRPLSLVMFDVDGFKAVNDSEGHQAGDRALRIIGRVLADQARAGDVPARMGGDEFAVIATDTDAGDALVLAERLRGAVNAALADAGLRVTLTGGVSDSAVAATADDLVRLADGALFWGKHHGRDQVVVYSPDTVQELTAEERVQRAQRASALAGLRALVRAVDARDAHTRQHSTRVADLAERLAARAGWDPQRRGRLREAAVLHDVGKIGVSDAVLSKPGRLTAEEYEHIKQHALLGAQITDGVLDPEQVAWVRGHHERIDGRGYPDGLSGEQIPDGARLLAVVDAFDAIMSRRPYRAARSEPAALAEMLRHRGTQFDPDLLDAFVGMIAPGATS